MTAYGTNWPAFLFDLIPQGGAAPKFLLTRDHKDLWHADGALPDDSAAAHYIVKLPKGKTQDGQTTQTGR